jgi:flagellar hook-associated protein 3 FlgL
MRISTSMMNQNAVNGIETAEGQVTQTQAQLSTGKSINSPADNPVGEVQLLQLNALKSQNAQYVANGTSATTNLSLENSALTTSTNTLQSIRDLVVEANSGTNTPADLQAIATQISSLESQLQGAANSQNSQGQYLFGGFASSTQPFVRNSAGAMTYAGDNGTNSVQLDAGTSVQTGDAGSTVFMNVQGGNGTFSTAAGSANTGTGVVDTGSVVNAATYAAAQTASPYTSPAPYTITFAASTTATSANVTSYSVTDGAGNPVTLGTDAGGNPITSVNYDPTKGAEVSFNGIQVGISGTPAAGDTYSVTPTTRQGVFTTIDNIVSALNNAGSDAASRARLTSTLGGSLQQIDNASNQVLNVAAAVGGRINLVTSTANSVNTNTLSVSAQISTVGDLDYAAASSKYSQQLVALQAAEQSYVAIENLSLFRVLGGG